MEGDQFDGANEQLGTIAKLMTQQGVLTKALTAAKLGAIEASVAVAKARVNATRAMIDVLRVRQGSPEYSEAAWQNYLQAEIVVLQALEASYVAEVTSLQQSLEAETEVARLTLGLDTSTLEQLMTSMGMLDPGSEDKGQDDDLPKL